VSLSIGIVGLPNVGKSTLFNALTRAGALAANYPFATIEPNVGVVGVPDPRLTELAKLYDSARVVPASVRFTDIAGLVRGASQGEGLGNQFLAHIRETDAICQVVRVFNDPDVTHVDGDVSPERDIETVITELILADLQTVEKALPRLAKENKFGKDPEKIQAVASATAAQEVLNQGITLSAAVSGKAASGQAASGKAASGKAAFTSADLAAVRDLQLLTAKPFLYVFNMDVSELADDVLRKRLADLIAPAEAIFLDAKTEADLAELDEAEAAELLAEAGLGEPGLNQLARSGFRALGLQTFLTAGPKESRAWEIRAGATAPEAAGVIHTDFQRGFIKAEIVSYEDLIAAGSVAAARTVGKARIEGKDYIMRDGDVVEFRFNV
jgi:ribosome-binding ATPase